MKHLPVLVLLIVLIFIVLQKGYSQEFDPYIQQQVETLEYDSLLSKLQTFENLGIKQAGTAALDETFAWLIQKHQQFGYSDIKIDTFQVGGNEVYNLIITKTGLIYPDTYLIIDGHYDTYNGPGVNDNGSGTAIVLEVARMMANVETAYSIKFIHFTVEELGLIGSTHYVENIVIPENMDIRLVFNIDEVGGVAGMANNTITCERDEWPPASNNAASAAFTDTLANLTEMYSNLNTNISYAYGSDYVPFMNNGYVVTGYYEYNESPWPHSINDSLSNMDPEYVFELTKASLAAALYFAGYENPTSLAGKEYSEELSIIPNPFMGKLRIENSFKSQVNIRFMDLTGRIIAAQELPAGSAWEIQPDVAPGTYLVNFTSADGKISFTSKILKK